MKGALRFSHSHRNKADASDVAANYVEPDPSLLASSSVPVCAVPDAPDVAEELVLQEGTNHEL